MIRNTAFFLVLALAPGTLLAAKPSPSPLAGESPNISLSASFTVDSKTLIPGKTLSPGDYTISVVDHLTDRVILRVTDKKGNVESTFLGLTSLGLPIASSAGPVRWTGQGSPALRGFRFPGAPPVEFVYPKAQAVTIAKGNSDKVLAIDPASDNLSIKHDKLSNQDMEIVTLWTLKSTRVGPSSQPAIEAAKYQPIPSPVPTPTPAPAQPTYVAKADAPVRPASRSSSEVASRPGTQASEPTPVPATRKQSATRKPDIAVLPHTASSLPLVLLASVLALLGAYALKLRRLYTHEA